MDVSDDAHINSQKEVDMTFLGITTLADVATRAIETKDKGIVEAILLLQSDMVTGDVKVSKTLEILNSLVPKWYVESYQETIRATFIGDDEDWEDAPEPPDLLGR